MFDGSVLFSLSLVGVLRMVSGACSANTSQYNGCYLKDYSSEWVTVNCTTGYVLTSALTCVPPCPSGSFLFGTYCVSCPSHCSSCFGPNEFQCIECDSTHTLNFQNICVPKCLVSSKYGSQADMSACAACDSTCATCFEGFDTTCTGCPADTNSATYTLKAFSYAKSVVTSGSCVKDASSDLPTFFRQYPTDKMVIQCPIGCSACTDRYVCTRCDDGYFLYPPTSSGAGYTLCYPS